MKPAILAIVIVVLVAAGMAGGLFYTWVLDPVEYVDTSPESLHIEDKLTYLALIGDLYMCEGDLAGTESRLAELGLEADGPVLAHHIEQYLDRGGRPEDVRHLAQLARELGASGGVLLVFGSEALPSPGASPSPTPGLEDTAQPEAVHLFPTATPVPNFRLVEQTALCAMSGEPGKIAVRVQDFAGNGLKEVEIVVSWAEGQDRFFTGLVPEQGAGYADFEMKPRTEYNVTLAGWQGDAVEELTSDLTPGICPTETVALSWQLTFEVETREQ